MSTTRVLARRSLRLSLSSRIVIIFETPNLAQPFRGNGFVLETSDASLLVFTERNARSMPLVCYVLTGYEPKKVL